MKKQKSIFGLVSYLETKILSLQYLELIYSKKKPGEVWVLDIEENKRFIQEYTYILSFISELPEAAEFKNLIKSPSKLLEMAENMLSNELKERALKEELKNRKAIENELKKHNK